MAHIGLHHRQTIVRHHAAQLLHAFFIGRNLGAQVGHVLRRVAAGVGPGAEQGHHGRLAQHTTFDQLEILNLHALLFDRGRKRRHRTRRCATNVGMVTARAHVKHGRCVVGQIHRRDHRHIGQMGAAVVGVVEHKHIAGLHAALVFGDHGFDALAHRTQVHRHVRRIGDQVALRVKQRTGKIQTLFDVDRVGGVLQLQTHLLGNVHEQVVEHLQQHRVHPCACGIGHCPWRDPREHQMVQGRQLGAPTRLDHRGGIGLGDDGRARDLVARTHIGTHHQGRHLPATRAMHANSFALGHIAQRVQSLLLLAGCVPGNHRFHRHRLHHQSLAAHQKRKALAISLFKPGLNVCQRTKRDDQGRIAALVAHMHTLAQKDLALTQGLSAQFLLSPQGQGLQVGQPGVHGLGAQAHLHRLLANQALIGQAHAVGRQHTRQRVHQDARHAQSVGHQTSVLPTGPTKTLQGVFGHVVAAGHRYFFDRIGHLLHSDVHKALGHRLHRHIGGCRRCGLDLRQQGIKARAHRSRVQSLVTARSKHMGEMLGLDFAQQHIGIGQGQRAAPAVTGRAWVGPRTLRAHPKPRPVKLQQRAPTCGHGVDAHHGRAHAHPCHLGFELALKLTRKMAHVSRGAAHVKANHPGGAIQSFAMGKRQLGRAGHAHNATRWPRQNRILALEGMGIGQATRGLHEVQRHARHLTGHLLDIAAQDGRQIRVHHRGVASAHPLHQGAGLVRRTHLGKTQLARQLCRLHLVRGVTVTMHEHDGHTAQTAPMGGLQLCRQVRHIQGLQHLTMRTHALLRLDHLGVEQLGQHNVPVKQARSVLVGDAQGIAKALGGDQQGRLALALEQRIGGHGGAHLHARHQRGGDGLVGLQAQQMPNARHRRVAVVLGVVAEQFMGDQGAIGSLAHDVGEGAASIDPELPLTVFNH